MYNSFDNLNATQDVTKVLEDKFMFSKLYEEKSTELSGPQTNKPQQNEDGTIEEIV